MGNSFNARRTGLMALLVASGFSLAACNTVEGAGEDIQGAGEAIEDTARDTEEDLSD